MTHKLFENNGAIFVGEGTPNCFRYQLWRQWDSEKDFVTFIGLNPSKANATQDDATIRRVIRFAQSWGYGGIYMVNLFAYVSTDPKVLLQSQEFKIGLKNDWAITDAVQRSARVIFAWGSFDVNGRDKQIIERYPNAYCLIVNQDGTPRHPLYVPRDIVPFKFSERGFKYNGKLKHESGTWSQRASEQ